MSGMPIRKMASSRQPEKAQKMYSFQWLGSGPYFNQVEACVIHPEGFFLLHPIRFLHWSDAERFAMRASEPAIVDTALESVRLIVSCI